MCFHIGPEFVDALLQAKEVDKPVIDTPSKILDGADAVKTQEEYAPTRDLVSRLRSFILTVTTVKWLLFVLWACL
jgi:hypothetical protein